MFKRLRYYTMFMMLLFNIWQAKAQIAMPDTVCIGSTRIYKVNDATTISTYTWKINGTTQISNKNEITINWNQQGTFLLSVQEHATNGCDGDIQAGLVYVKPFPIADAGKDATICFGVPYQLNGSGGSFFQWAPPANLSNTTIANPFVNTQTPGIHKYFLTVTDDFGCKSVNSDTVVLTVLSPAKIFAGRDTSISLNQQLQLNAIDVSNSGFINYVWSPSFGLSNAFTKNPVALFNNLLSNNGITYTVTGRTIDGCEAKDDITVKIFLKADIYVPTGFTPNGDGLNDFAKVIPVGIKELKQFTIYNRWGEMVFTTHDASTGWNGIWKGSLQPNAVFVWIAEGVDYNGTIISKKGSITLIR